MDGLECSEILKSELEFSGRIDAEYYQKKFLQYQAAIEKHSILPLSKIADFLIGPFGSAYDTSTYVEQSDYRYIRGQDVKPFLLQDASPRYHVLKQVVDQNIWRLKQLKLLPSASQAAAEKDYNREPPPDIDWPTDEEAKFTWFYYEMLKLNKDGARVLLKGKIDFTEHHYETECTVRWNESLSETAIKNASITRVVESQEKELAAAI